MPGAARDVLEPFRRWPTWMWANWEVAALAEWPRDHDLSLPEDRRVGHFGRDAWVLISRSSDAAPSEAGPPDTYPWGV